VATTLAADVIILTSDEFVAATHSTKTVEERLDFSGIASEVTPTVSVGAGEVRKDVTAEVNGRRITVALWSLRSATTGCRARSARQPSPASAPRWRLGQRIELGERSNAGHDRQGQRRSRRSRGGGDTVMILEAMKMENSVNAERSGVVKSINAATGDSVSAGDVVAVIE